MKNLKNINKMLRTLVIALLVVAVFVIIGYYREVEKSELLQSKLEKMYHKQTMNILESTQVLSNNVKDSDEDKEYYKAVLFVNLQNAYNTVLMLENCDVVAMRNMYYEMIEYWHNHINKENYIEKNVANKMIKVVNQVDRDRIAKELFSYFSQIN